MKKQYYFAGIAFLFLSAFIYANHSQKDDVHDAIDEFMRNKEYEKKTELCHIMTSCGSDKGHSRHNNSTLYAKLFQKFKNEKIKIFELGLGTNNTDVKSNMGPGGIPGASLRGWKNYFPNALIYGADIDKRILFREDRIETFYCDQTNPVCIHQLFSNELKGMEFDIIIEDGLHEFEANRTFLLNAIPYLKSGGLYIVEDLNTASVAAFRKILPDLKSLLSVKYIDIIELPNPLNNYDNALLIIEK